MKEYLLLILIGISLSIDAFSVSSVIGLSNISSNKKIKTSIIVGIFHFIMPLLGVLSSILIKKYININTNIILGIILLFISLQMIIEFIKPTNKELNINGIGIILFAIGVSLDSYSVGLGLYAITNKILLASTIFTICSFSFTYLGLTIGKYISIKLKNNAYIVSALLLFIIGIIFICK